MKQAIAIYTNRSYIKSYRYSPDFLVVKPIYFKKDLELLKRFLAAQVRCDKHSKTNCYRNANEERNRKARRNRAIQNLYRLRAKCHQRKLFTGPYGGKGQFTLDLSKTESL